MNQFYSKACAIVAALAICSFFPSRAQNNDFITPSHGVSIGTVKAAEFHPDLIIPGFSLGTTPYLVTPSEGIYLGFDKTAYYDTYSGRYTEGVTLNMIYSTENDITIPDYIVIDNETLPVLTLNIRYEMRSNLLNLEYINLTVPETMKELGGRSYDTYYQYSFYMLGLCNLIDSLTGAEFYICRKSDFDNYRNSRVLANNLVSPYGWDFEWVTVNVASPGQLVQTYLENNDYDWNVAKYLKVTGSLNSSDMNAIKSFPDLYKLDLTGTNIYYIPDNFLSSKTYFKEILLSDNVKSIGNNAFDNTDISRVAGNGLESIGRNAFYNCKYLIDIKLDNVKTIGEFAFYYCEALQEANLANVESIGASAFDNCTSLQRVVLGNNLEVIPSYAFSAAISLDKIEIPTSVKTIDYGAFNYCISLKEVTLNEGLETIGINAFNLCSSLQSISLPSTLSLIRSYAFKDSGLSKIECAAVIPPDASEFIGYNQGLNTTLYVPSLSLDLYRNTAYWNYMASMYPLDSKVTYINVLQPFTLDSSYSSDISDDAVIDLGYDYEKMSGYYSNGVIGELTLAGNGTVSIDKFNYKGIKTLSYGWEYVDKYAPSLINEGVNFNAREINQTLLFPDNVKWYFVSLPYDAKVIDILPNSNTYWTIRRYDSAARAASDMSDTWVNLTNNDILEAGKGYIIAVDRNYNGFTETYDDNYASLTFKSYNSTASKFFANSDVEVNIKEYPSEFSHNQSWNLVGNPYPCYYDISYLKDEFSVPITVWNGNVYEVYSPRDDEYMLSPFEAFFIQAPQGVTSLKFGAEGRLHTSSENISTYATRGSDFSATKEIDRNIFNFFIKCDDYLDKTRIVLNPAASMSYETGRDVSKFFNEESSMAQIYVNSDSFNSIDERPLSNGEAVLGLRSGEKATYTLSLGGIFTPDYQVWLYDTVTGKEVELTKTDYIFETEDKENTVRFKITFMNENAGVESIESSISKDSVVCVSNLAGQIVYRGSVTEIKVPSEGIYIINDGKNSVKALLK